MHRDHLRSNGGDGTAKHAGPFHYITNRTENLKNYVEKICNKTSLMLGGEPDALKDACPVHYVLFY